MKHVDISGKDDRVIKVSDDSTYQDVTIYCDNVYQANNLIIKLVTELLKGE